MGSVYQRGKQWVIMWKGVSGTWHEKRTKCVTKAEAKLLLKEVEISVERQLLGVEATPTRRAHESFGELLDWIHDGKRPASGRLD